MRRFLLYSLFVVLLVPNYGDAATQHFDVINANTINNTVEIKKYASLTAAVSAIGSTPTRLKIDRATTLTGNTTIPATLELEITRSGSINQGTYTLTINGPFEAGHYQVFTGSGTVVFGPANRSKSPPEWTGTTSSTVDTIQRTHVTGTGQALHAFEDRSTISFDDTPGPNVNAYASFDANTTTIGAGVYDHIVGFQSRPTYTGSGGITDRFDGLVAAGTHSGSGTIAKRRGLFIQEVLGAGPITTNYGIYIEPLTRGTDNVAIYSESGRSYFGGPFAIANYLQVGSIADDSGTAKLNVADKVTVRAEAGNPALVQLKGDGATGGDGLSLLDTSTDSQVWQASNKILKFGTNNTLRITIKADGIVNIVNTPSYANNAAALAGGLVAGDIYRNGDVLMIVH